VGSGNDRSWNDLASGLFKAMSMPLTIDYIAMPKQIQGKYQNYTKANMQKLKSTGCPVGLTGFEDAVSDYVLNYLQKEDPYL